MTRKLTGIKPQDILILLKILVHNAPLSQTEMGSELGLSGGEVSYGLNRLKNTLLINKDGIPNRRASLEFLTYAVPYIAPGTIGRISRGIPTAHSGPDLSKQINGHPHESYVLEHPDGLMRGQAVSPVYRTAAHAAFRDQELHRLLALVDAVRVGKARERRLAMKFLEEQICDVKQGQL